MFSRLYFFAFILALIAVAPAATSGTVATISAVRGKVVAVKVPAGFKSVTLWQKTGLKVSPVKMLAQREPAIAGGNVMIVLRKAVAPRSLFVTGERATASTTGAGAAIHLFLADPALARSNGFTGSGGATPGVVSLDSAAVSSLSLGSTAAVAPTRSVAESDIWRVAGDRLYFFNELRGLQVFDVSNPDDPALLGQLREPNHGEQMYLLDPTHVALLTRPSYFFNIYAADASVASLDRGSGAVLVADVSAGQPTEVARLPYPGYLVESRLVGTALYVVSEVYDGTENGLQVTSFDLSDPAHPQQVDTLNLGSYGGVITATERFLFVVRYSSTWRRSTIDLIDISAPNGALVQRGKIEAAGIVNDKFKMHLEGDVLTVVSAVPRDWSSDPKVPANLSHTMVETFTLAHPATPARLGALKVGVGESVRATRFADGRLYVVTFFSIDPLWVIDLADPRHPTLLGELEVPGFSNYIEPYGDRLVAIGHVGSQTAVSLFDVSDPTQPRLLSQLPLGDGYSYSEANWDEKAFSVIPDHELILVPYSGYDSGSGWASRVQLITLKRDSLRARGVVDEGFSIRRTAIAGNRFLAISSSNLVTLNLADRDHPRVTSNVAIAWRTDRVFLVGNHLLQIGGAVGWQSTAAPTLTVSTSADPDTALSVRDLDPVPVIGASLRGGRLYVAQQQSTSWWYLRPLVINTSGVTNPPSTTNPLTLSVFDVSHLPAVTLLGKTQADATPSSYGYGGADLEAAWPDDSTLVWVRPSWNSWWWGGPIGLLHADSAVPGAVVQLTAPPFLLSNTSGVTTGAGTLTLSGSNPFTGVQTLSAGALAVSGPALPTGALSTLTAASLNPNSTTTTSGTLTVSNSIIWMPPWYRSSSGHELVVFDVSAPSAPQLAAQVDVRSGQTGDWSAPITAGGQLFLSFVAYDDPRPLATDAVSRRFRHFMKQVGFADPTKPAIGDEVNIPGRLLAVANGGATLLTVGCGFDSDAQPNGKRVFHASHFDGTAATLVDQLETPTAWDPYALDRATLLVGTYPLETSQPGQLQAWRIGSDEKFSLANQIAVPAFYSLSTLHGLLLGSGAGMPHLFDVSDPTKLLDRGDVDTTALSTGSLGRAAGGAGRGIWLPLGDYGVGVVPLAK